MITSSNGNIFPVTGPLCGEYTGEFPSQRPVMRSFDIFFDLRMNKRLSKQSWGWWFDMPSCSLWRHCNEKYNFSALAIWFRLFCIKPSRVLWMLRRLKPPTTHKFFNSLSRSRFLSGTCILNPKSLGIFLLNHLAVFCVYSKWLASQVICRNPRSPLLLTWYIFWCWYLSTHKSKTRQQWKGIYLRICALFRRVCDIQEIFMEIQAHQLYSCIPHREC